MMVSTRQFWLIIGIYLLFAGPAFSAIYTVTNSGDSGPGTLRQAMLDANATDETDRIHFNIPGAGPHVIRPASTLPLLTDSLWIEGYTQPGATPATANQTATIQVEIDASQLALAGGNQWTLQTSFASDERINLSGLAIHGGELGLHLTGSASIIHGCWFGLNASGQPFPCVYDNIQIHSPQNRIGGPNPEDANVFLPNRYGVYTARNAGYGENTIQNNRFGTDPTGVMSLMSSNAVAGVGGSRLVYLNSPSNVVEDNQFGGGFWGMQINTHADNIVRRNRFYLDATGNVPLQGNGYGLYVSAPNTVVEDNIFGPCRQHTSWFTHVGNGSTIRGNQFGLTLGGDTPLTYDTGNDSLRSAWDCVIAGPNMLVENNVFSGSSYGVTLHSIHCTNTVARNNRIATDASGMQAVPHRVYGMRIHQASHCHVHDNQFGPAANTALFVDHANAHNNLIENNSFGLDASGAAVLPIIEEVVNGTSISINTHSNTVRGNVISGGKVGISLRGGTARKNQIENNQIGTTRSGLPAPLSNAAIFLNVAANENALTGNLVAYGFAGIILNGASNNVIQANRIGIEPDGSAGSIQGSGLIAFGYRGIYPTQGNQILQNEIAHCDGAGIVMSSELAIRNRLSQNSLHNNAGPGIELLNNTDLSHTPGPNPPDAGDLDIGGNGMQNAPLIHAARAETNGSSEVSLTLISQASTTYQIEYFATPNTPGNDDEGKEFLGTDTQATDANGSTTWTTSLPNRPAGTLITATATDPDGNTSEFSPAIPVAFEADIALSQTFTPTHPNEGDAVTLRLIAENNGPGDAGAISLHHDLDGLIYTSSSGDGIYDPQTGNWDLAGLNAGDRAEHQILVTIPAGAGGRNMAPRLIFNRGDVIDTTPANNESTTIITPPCPSMVIQGKVLRNGSGVLGVAVEAKLGDLLYAFDTTDSEGRYKLIVPDGQEMTVNINPAPAGGGPDETISFQATAPACARDVTLAAAQSGIHIHEFVANNDTGITDEDGDHEDWIELHNPTPEAIDLTNFTLSDLASNPTKWILPEVRIPGGGFLVIFASGKDRIDPNGQLHASFKLSTDGEFLGLFAPNGRLLDAIAPVYPAQIDDVAYGRWQGEWTYLEPTPGSANQAGDEARLPPPVADLKSGFYTENQTVGFAPVAPGVTIHYTLDGSEPTENAPFVTGPLSIADRAGDPNVFSEIPAAFETFGWLPTWSPPVGEVQKATVFRARAFAPGFAPSKTKTWTWFVDANAGNLYEGLPVISLVGTPTDLFSDSSGIMVPGFTYAGTTSSGNFFQEWNRLAHVTMFETDRDVAFSQQTRIKISGSTSPNSPQKGLHVIADDDHGPNRFKHDIFRTSPGHAKDQDEFKRFILRSYSSDAGRAMITDAFTHRTAFPAGILATDYRACVVFINGEFWGLNEIREHNKNSFYLEQHTGDDRDAPGYDVMQYGRGDGYYQGYHIDEGSNDNWIAFMEFLDSNSVSNVVNYGIATNWVDVADLIAYTGVEIYSGNIDWPVKNDAQFRPRREDAKWKFLLFDTDHSFAGITREAYAVDLLARSLPGGRRPHPVLYHMIENPEFRNQFINWFADAMNSFYHPDILHPMLTEMVDEIRPVMDEHDDRWSFTDPRSGAYSNVFEVWVSHAHDFIDLRPEHMIAHLTNRFGLTNNPEPLTLDINNPAQGNIRINSIILGQTLGATEFPWTCNYFPEVPVRLTAIARPGYRFVRWTGAINAINNTDPSIEVSVSQANDLRAEFEPDPEYLSQLQTNLVLTEIHYNPDQDPDQEFLEFHNRGSTVLDISGLTITGAVNFTFDAPASIPPGEFVVIIEDTDDFHEAYSNFNPIVVGKWAGRLSDGGEEIVLTAGEGTELLRLTYDDKLPWPEGADGDGHSLELLDLEANISSTDGWNWRPSCLLEGSPGFHPDCNTPPVWLPTTNAVIPEGHTWRLAIESIDRESQAIAETLRASPAGMTLSDSLVQWTPGEADGPSTQHIQIVATDSGSPALANTQTFTLVIEEVPTAPLISPLLKQSISELQELTFTPSATDTPTSPPPPSPGPSTPQPAPA